ncbi:MULTISPECIES: DUF4189 domain-containing protein [Xanthomonas]|uniref:DUF4189 domain-containing protein n=1 Tax=Xanthomonas TaxID=338 RepID=UPI0022556528|nr:MULTISPECIES: DUF4189 domain-containing protein [Xanthomonas]MDY4283120.1 DUF4189 domain-containing protein [Xanthomonas sp. LF06-19]
MYENQGSIFLFHLAFPSIAAAEGGCPPGQLPAQSNGNIASCTPIPQGYYQQQSPQPRPLGDWIKTWGAIAMGTIDGVPHYGVPVGKTSKSDAQSDAIDRCVKSGAIGCKVILTYFNQCAALAEPRTPAGDIVGRVVAVGRSSIKLAESAALEGCGRENGSSQCGVAYKACSDPIFKKF